MATDLETRKASAKPDAYLRRQFAELCARIKRADLLAHLLVLALAMLCYALFIGILDWIAGNSTAVGFTITRWAGFALFVGLSGLLVVRTIRCLLSRVNPYFIAYQIEQTSPGAKNTLINWLDMQDEEIPAAFQRNLSARAAEQLQEADLDKAVRPRSNWVLLGLVPVPLLGLVILLFLGPAAFAQSMLRAFVPFYSPEPIARTQITLVQPQGGDAEVSPGQSLTITARIEGRVPVGSRPDAPTLSYRYHASEDYLTQPLQQDAAGLWTTQLHAGQIRTGLSYRLSAGDAVTPEHEVRVRGRAHVKQFEITYQHRPYRKAKSPATVTFPNEFATRPVVSGFPGSDVELVIRASQPVKKAKVEIVTGKDTKELALTKLTEDAFACKWTLDRPGEFRVLFTSIDGEENADRELYRIDVPADDVPTVILMEPGKDVQLPANGTLVLKGEASSPVGIKGLVLHLRMLNNPTPIVPMPYRPGKSFKHDDGTYEGVIEYNEVVPLEQLDIGKGTLHSPPAGTVIEYWLEATDASDFPDQSGNTGKSLMYKVTLTAPANATQEDSNRQNARAQQKEHHKQQDDKVAKGKDKGNGGKKDPKQELDAANKSNQGTGDKVRQALNDQNNDKDRGNTKSSGPPNTGSKGSPPDGPQPQQKEQKSPASSGDNKTQGAGKSKGGESKDNGNKSESDPSKGDRKDAPKDKQPLGSARDGGAEKKEPPGGTKDAGDKGMNAPMPAQPKEEMANDGPPQAKSKGTKPETQNQGHTKGAEHNGPETPPKNAGKPPEPPPNAHAKKGMGDPGGSKSDGTPPPNQAGNARPDDAKGKNGQSDLDKIQDGLGKLQDKDEGNQDAGGALLAKLAGGAADPDQRALAKAILEKNGRDPKTGRKEKLPVGATDPGKSPGFPEELKVAAANREFAARIGQMQLEDWKKRISPEVLKRAGVSEAEWQRYVKSMQSYGDMVRELNAKIARDALKELHHGANAGVKAAPTSGTRNTQLEGVRPDPPELRDPIRRFRMP